MAKRKDFDWTLTQLEETFSPPPRPSKTENPVTFFLRNNLFIRNPHTPYNLPLIIKSYLNTAHQYFQEKIGVSGGKAPGKLFVILKTKIKFLHTQNMDKTFVIFKAITLYVSKIYIVQENVARMDSNVIYVF